MLTHGPDQWHPALADPRSAFPPCTPASTTIATATSPSSAAGSPARSWRIGSRGRASHIVLLEAGEIAHGSTAATHRPHPVRDRHPPRRPDRARRARTTPFGATGSASMRCAASALAGRRRRLRLARDPEPLPREPPSRPPRARAGAARPPARPASRSSCWSERDIRERFSFSRPAALLSPVAGEVDAYRLTHKLLAEATAAGLEVYDRTPVVGYAERAAAASSSAPPAGPGFGRARWCSPPATRRPSSSTDSLVRLHSTYALRHGAARRASTAGARTAASSGRPHGRTSTPE